MSEINAQFQAHITAAGRDMTPDRIDLAPALNTLFNDAAFDLGRALTELGRLVWAHREVSEGVEIRSTMHAIVKSTDAIADAAKRCYMLADAELWDLVFGTFTHITLLERAVAVLDSEGGVKSMSELAAVVAELDGGDFTQEYEDGGKS